MAIENETEFMSLSQLAEMQTDEIQTLTTRLPPAGIFVVKGDEVKASESRQEGKPPLFRYGFTVEVLQAQPLDKDKDPEDLVGRKLRETYTLWPSDFNEAIGLLKGRYKMIGLEPTGILGGVEGADPGWLDTMVGHIWRVRVRHANVNGQDRAFFDWLPLEDESKEEDAA